MPVLTIATADLRRLAGIDAADTSFDAALAAVQTAEQDALEYAIDPDTLEASGTDSGLAATLTLGVSEQLAGTYLQQLARAPAPLGGLSIGPVKITPPSSSEYRALGNDLAAKGAARVAPYLRAVGAAALAAAKVAIAQGQAAKVAVEDAAGNGALAAPPPVSVFDSDFSGALDVGGGE